MSVPKSPCDTGDGTFDHDWKVVSDWGGDSSVPGGTFDCSFLRCATCGEENTELDPRDYAPGPLEDDVI